MIDTYTEKSDLGPVQRLWVDDPPRPRLRHGPMSYRSHISNILRGRSERWFVENGWVRARSTTNAHIGFFDLSAAGCGLRDRLDDRMQEIMLDGVDVHSPAWVVATIDRRVDMYAPSVGVGWYRTSHDVLDRLNQLVENINELLPDNDWDLPEDGDDH